MKCEEFIEAIERGSVVRRTAARWHATRCARCAAVRRRWIAIKQDWAAGDAPDAVHREVWEQAATTEWREAPVRVRPAVAWGGVGVAAAAIACVGVVWISIHRVEQVAQAPAVGQNDPIGDLPDLQRDPSQVTFNEGTTNEHTLKEVMLNEEVSMLTDIEQGLDQLAIELTELETQATLLDAEHDVEQLITRFRPLVAASTSN